MDSHAILFKTAQPTRIPPTTFTSIRAEMLVSLLAIMARKKRFSPV